MLIAFLLVLLIVIAFVLGVCYTAVRSSDTVLVTLALIGVILIAFFVSLPASSSTTQSPETESPSSWDGASVPSHTAIRSLSPLSPTPTLRTAIAG